MGCCCGKTVVDPKKPRSCTDVFALFIFFVFLVGMSLITFFASQFAVNLTTDNAENIVSFLNSFDTVQQAFSDLCKCYVEIFCMCGLSLLLSFASVFLLRCCAVVLIYGSFFILFGGAVALLGLFWYWYAYDDSLQTMSLREGFHNVTDKLLLIFGDENNQVLLTGFVILSVVVMFFLIVCCCVACKSMKLVVELFQQADRCISAMPLLLLQPVWTFLALLAFLIYWFFVALLIFVATNVRMSTLPVVQTGNFTINIADYSISLPVKYVWWYHFIGLIWVSEFIYACHQMVIACSVTIWYFAKDKKNLNCAVLKGTKRLCRYHLGSVACGSFIITCVKVPRMVLMYLKKKSETTESLFVKYVLTACICCFWCAEKCLKYIHQNAYTIIAIEGRGFCPSTVKACTILLKNAMQMTTVNLLSKFVLFVCKCAVTVVVGLISLIWFRNIEAVHYWLVPVIIVCVFTFFVSDCFFSVYEMVIDTLFICHCEYKSITVEKEDVRIDGEAPDLDAVDPTVTKFMENVIEEDKVKKPPVKQAEAITLFPD